MPGTPSTPDPPGERAYDPGQDREPGYAELLAAVLALRPDVATVRFDSLLAELLADERIDPGAARELRWWQRESVRAIGDYLTETAPALLVGLEASQRSAQEAATVAEAAWQRATTPVAAEPEPAPGTSGVDAQPAAPGGHERPGPATAGGASAALHDPPRDRDIVVDLRLRVAPPDDAAGPVSRTEQSTVATGRHATPSPAPPGVSTAVASSRRRLLLSARALHPDPPDAS